MQFKAQPRHKVVINITSLIDVMFLLLIFFMVSSTFLEQAGMKLNLPGAQTGSLEEVKELVIEISSQGQILLNGNPIELSAVQKTLTESLARSAEATLVLKADEKVSHGQVVKVMDLARAAGIRKLVIATRPEPEN